MGLGITVGLLSDLARADSASAEALRQDFHSIARAMAKAGLPPHHEPDSCEVWSAEGYGYTGLHALREVAGLVWRDQPIPMDRLLTGDVTPNAYQLFDAIAAACAPPPHIGLFARLFGETDPEPPVLPPFAHLILHSDAEGHYVPADFVRPLIPLPYPRGTEKLWPVGSVQRLAAELERLAHALKLPDAPPDPDDLLETWLEGSPPPVTAPWQAQPIAAHSLLILRMACDHSLQTGAAISLD